MNAYGDGELAYATIIKMLPPPPQTGVALTEIWTHLTSSSYVDLKTNKCSKADILLYFLKEKASLQSSMIKGECCIKNGKQKETCLQYVLNVTLTKKKSKCYKITHLNASQSVFSD